MEGNYKRALAGSTDDPYLENFGEGVLELARTGRRSIAAYGQLTARSNGSTARATLAACWSTGAA